MRVDQSAHYRELLDIYRARTEIYDALVRYCRGVDRMDRDLIRFAYHPDANDNHGSYNGPIDGFIEWIFANHQGQVMSSVHHLGNVMLEIAGSLAHGESYVLVNHRRMIDGRLYDLLSHGRFLDRFADRDGKWKIIDRVVVLDWDRLDPVDQRWDEPLTGQLLKAERSRDDPSYAALSSGLDITDR
jgi:hypothetical protein